MAWLAFDPFEALGLPRDAPATAIKQRYHTLARKYHPNRHQGDDRSKATLSDNFHHIHEAWKILSHASNRKRRMELLRLLELQDDMFTHFMDLVTAQSLDEQEIHHHHPQLSDQDGHLSSDGDEDLPHVGLLRRQTFMSRGSKHLGDGREGTENVSPTKKSSRWTSVKAKALRDANGQKEADYFVLRRKKLEKLQRKEFEAFEMYRNAMVAKFEAEEEAEKLQELYESAKWRREYFERAPRGTTERMRAFLNTIGAVSAFEQHAPRPHHSSLSYSTMSPTSGPGEAGQFLIPDQALARRKSIHRRGWSNDMSGDQTSSSEEESPHSDFYGSALGRRPSPPGHGLHRYSKRSKNVVGSGFRFFPNGAAKENPLSRRDDPVSFQLVVRQPTELAAIAEAQDSSGETASGSSRSPSPLPGGTHCDDSSKFTMVASSRAVDLFDVTNGRRARSPSSSGSRQPVLAGSKADESHVAANEGCNFTIEHAIHPQHRHVPLVNVHLLTRHQKSHLLGSELDSAAAVPEELLGRLRRLDPQVASKFEVKPNMEDAFNFRLIYGNREVTSRQHQSFIALSYRRKLLVERHQHHYTLPLEKEIFQAVLDERKSDTEGVWIDQICIDQESAEERTISMSAMDMVYRSARLIVVALDDIELETYEGELLENHFEEYNGMTHVSPRQRFRHKQPAWLDSHEDLYKVVRKLLSSSWFKRAWCRHEMRLAKHHVFLIPCKRAGTWSGRDVVRFNSKCLAHLLDLSTEVPFEPEVESVKPALHAFFRDRSKMSSDEREMQTHHGNFSTVVAEVFAMEAGGDPRIEPAQRLSDARKDKISIVLNTMECGLSLEKRFRVDGYYEKDNECFHDLSLLALAAADPGVLCSVGAPLPISSHVSSWLYIPTVADAGLNETKTLPRLSPHARFVTNTHGTEHSISIDLKFLPRRGDRPQIEPEVRDFARAFIDACEERGWGRNRKRYLTLDRRANLLFGPMKEIYVDTLACVLHCGPDWMSDVCQRYGMSRWKVDLQGAFELLIALKNTNGAWPVDAWGERAAGFVMDFVNFLVIRGLPLRQLAKPEPWRPIWVRTPQGGKVITFVPVDDRHVRPAIPTVLSHEHYVHLARLWILQPRSISDESRRRRGGEHEGDDDDVASRSHTPSTTATTTNTTTTTAPTTTTTTTTIATTSETTSEWTLLGKSVLFSDELSITHMSSYGGDFKDQQRVFGRHRGGEGRVSD